MTSSKTQRDALNNQRFQDTYVHASQEPWVQWYPGIDFKLLRATQETGHWTILVNCSKGSSIPRHEHLGAGEYYVISGKMEVRGGVENGGITAIAGDYGYEPNGVIHDMTNFPEDTILYFTNFGPIRYIDDDNNTVGFLDWQGVLKAAEEGTAKTLRQHKQHSQPCPPPGGEAEGGAAGAGPLNSAASAPASVSSMTTRSPYAAITRLSSGSCPASARRYD